MSLRPAIDPPGDEDIFGTPDVAADEAALARAEADFVHGRIISHEAMRRWLLSWGSPQPEPPPKCGE